MPPNSSPVVRLTNCHHLGTRLERGPYLIVRYLRQRLFRMVVLDFSRPGKPTDNSYIESFNGKFRAECLNAHWFMSYDDARAKMEDWRRDL